MAVLDQFKRLKKELSLLGVYAIALGTTLSAGFFLLPGLAVAEAGPAVVVSYLIAAALLVPAMLCIVELATAMPRAGGAYYFLDRSLGPLAGTIGGMGTWLALTLKTSFALVGMGAYLRLFIHDAPVELIAVGLALVFGAINVFGSKNTANLQIILVTGLMAIVTWFIIVGGGEIDTSHFDGFLDKGSTAVFSTAGLVFISYVGVTNVASVSEEVKDPERNLPRGIFLALGTAVAVYGLGVAVMVGVLGEAGLSAPENQLTPAAAVATSFAGQTGKVIVSIAAILAFTSVANAGIMSSSRYPLAMGRDQLLPGYLKALGRWGTPTRSIVITVAAIIVYITVLDPIKIAKLASAFQLLMFAMLCLAVIVMRESGIQSYDPGYRSPWYPWLHIVGFIAPIALIGMMGWLPIVFASGLVILGIVWFRYYASARVSRVGAIYHVFERLGRKRFDALDVELRGILKEKGLRKEDPFDEIVARSAVIDARRKTTFENIVKRASAEIARQTPESAASLAERFLEGTRTGATPVSGAVALPHLRLSDLPASLMVIVRCQPGLHIDTGRGDEATTDPSEAIFFLVSPDADPAQHLRLLAQLATRVDRPEFLDEWRRADDERQLKATLLRHERYLAIVISRGGKTDSLIDQAIRDITLPEGCLVAVIRRDSETFVPGGQTVLRENDELTVIGSRTAIKSLYVEYGQGMPQNTD